MLLCKGIIVLNKTKEKGTHLFNFNSLAMIENEQKVFTIRINC